MLSSQQTVIEFFLLLFLQFLQNEHKFLFWDYNIPEVSQYCTTFVFVVIKSDSKHTNYVLFVETFLWISLILDSIVR